MKLEGVIYFYCPKESDLKDRDMLREHLVRPTAGRIFLQISEEYQWTIPFSSTTHLVSILNEVRTSNIDDCHAHYLGQEGLDAQKASKFSSDATGQFTLLDTEKDYKYRYIYFTDMLDAGIQLDKIFSREVAKRIPVNETVNIPYDVED